MSDKPAPTSPELSILDPTPLAPAPASAADASASPAPAAAPPPRPSRPLSPRSQAKATLIEAFPNVDEGVIEAVLVASGGNVEPAFNALLGMTDPTYKPESADIVPREDMSSEHPGTGPRTSTPLTQLEQDELLARQLAGEGRHRSEGRRVSRDRQQAAPPRRQSQDKEHSFIDDDLPIIKDNIKKGWATLVSRVKSKLDGEGEQPPPQPPRPGEYDYHQRTSRYDADPRVLGDDFSHLNVQDQNAGYPPRQSHRPLANPNLFKSTRFSNNENSDSPPTMPPRPDQQKPVSASVPPTQSHAQSLGGSTQAKKWEPLRPAEDRDPFAVGDSDDEEGKDEDLYGMAPTVKVAGSSGEQESEVVSSVSTGPGSKS